MPRITMDNIFCSKDCPFADDDKESKKRCGTAEMVFCRLMDDCMDEGDPCKVEYGVYLERLKDLKVKRDD